MRRYRIAVNLELTGKCNARCVMCPRDAVVRPTIMSLDNLRSAVARLDGEDVYRVVVAGYGEPTTHPRFEDCLEALSASPVRIDMVSNGQLLDEARLARIDGLVHTLIISYSSIDPEVYAQVHVNLDHARVTRNILLARQRLRRTALAISLTPLSICLPSLPRTVGWLRSQGVIALTMSPTLYDRAGAIDPSAIDAAPVDLRSAMRAHGLRSQEFDFVPSLREVFAQWRANRHRCIPRNSDLAIAADGTYQYCFNDVGHSRPIGHVATMGIRAALALRERSDADPRLCAGCGLRRRYGPAELGRALLAYLREKNAVRSAAAP